MAERKNWTDELEQVKRMRQWVLDAEHILDCSWAAAGEAVSNEQVGASLSTTGGNKNPTGPSDWSSTSSR